jgi:hypothetical protein
MKKAFILILLCSVFSCKKNQTQSVTNNPVPSVPVNYTIYPDNPLNFKLQAIGGWMYIDNVGVNGIIVYRKSTEEFVAIERTSSYLPNNPGAKVKVLSDNFTLRDSISNSQWRIIDGTVTKAPATWALRLYGTTLSSDKSTLVIRN